MKPPPIPTEEAALTDQRALRASELSYRRLFEAARDGILILEVETGRITDVNPYLEELLGFTHAEMVGKTVGELSPFKDVVSNQAMLERLQQDGYVRYENLPLETRDGRKVDVEFVCNVYQAGDQQVIQCNVRDNTARKQAEAAGQASEARYRTLFDYAPDGIVIADPRSRYLDANPSICQMLGYAREELVGLDATDIVVPEEIPHIGEALATIQARSDHQREWRFRRKDGSVFPAEVIATLMPDGNLLGLIRDSTERRQTEQALRASEEHFRFLNDLVEATRPLTDPTQIMAVSARLLGGHLGVSRCAYADVEPDGEQFTILHEYTDGCASTVGRYALSRFGPQAVATLHGGQTLIIRDVQAELRPDEGADMFNAIGIQAIITCPLVKAGALRALMAVHSATPRDWQPDEIALVREVVERCWATIERRTAAATIRQLNADLEQRVTERTVQLKSANEELEAFSFSVSHDLRAPLRHVMGFVDLLKKDAGPALSDKSSRYLATISLSAKRMGDLIDDLLAFSRIGRTALQKTEVNLDALVRETVEEFQLETKERAINWTIHPLPAVWADRALLRLVLVNLVSNAVKFTSLRAEARIELGPLPGGEGETVIFIRDNGAGFDPQYAGKLFGVFQRLHREDQFEGTGIGLANVHRIIARHGGRVWAEGVVDGGATFYLAIPSPPGATHET